MAALINGTNRLPAITNCWEDRGCNEAPGNCPFGCQTRTWRCFFPSQWPPRLRTKARLRQVRQPSLTAFSRPNQCQEITLFSNPSYHSLALSPGVIVIASLPQDGSHCRAHCCSLPVHYAGCKENTVCESCFVKPLVPYRNQVWGFRADTAELQCFHDISQNINTSSPEMLNGSLTASKDSLSI